MRHTVSVLPPRSRKPEVKRLLLLMRHRTGPLHRILIMSTGSSLLKGLIQRT